MKSRLLILILIACCFCGCSTYKNTLQKETEKILIYIYPPEGNENDQDAVKIEISNKNEIKKIINYTTRRISPGYKCGYDGKIEYLCAGNNVIMEMVFNVSCNTMVFVYDDKLFTRRISKNGLEYFKAMR